MRIPACKHPVSEVPRNHKLLNKTGYFLIFFIFFIKLKYMYIFLQLETMPTTVQCPVLVWYISGPPESPLFTFQSKF